MQAILESSTLLRCPAGPWLFLPASVIEVSVTRGTMGYSLPGTLSRAITLESCLALHYRPCACPSDRLPGHPSCRTVYSSGGNLRFNVTAGWSCAYMLNEMDSSTCTSDVAGESIVLLSYVRSVGARHDSTGFLVFDDCHASYKLLHNTRQHSWQFYQLFGKALSSFEHSA